ncbi:MAG: amidohydrolase family protein [Pseudomonadales bacterium]|nr:D-aminoacylase [Pseudomonadales bacterium]NIX07944.1 amidohydrolase family protein [Pseudomonadales bacterium]
MIDTIIRDVEILDGTGAAPRTGDVGVQDGRLLVDPAQTEATETLDGRGLALAPGFIDVHTHDDFAAVLHPDMAFKVRGGVTTCVVGNCGLGAAPFPQASVMARAFHPNQPLPRWDGYAGYLSHLDGHRPSVNIAVLVGHGTLRLAAMGSAARPPDDSELGTMRELLEEGLEAGAVGLSSGLIYEPGRHAKTEELIELASTMRGTQGLYATHMRDEGNHLLESVQEAIDIGRRAGVGVQISHHKASGRAAWGLVERSLALIDAAQQAGLNVHADQYPYTAGSTVLSAVYRPGRFGTGSDELTPDDVVIASANGHPEWEGRSISQLADDLGVDPDQVAGQVLDACPGATVILHSMSEEDVQTVMRHSSTMIGSDGIPTLEGRPHPRLYGTFARVLGHYCRDLDLFPLNEAVYRMTGFPASKFGFTDRGEIRDGLAADLVLFDPKRIIDVGTFASPNRYPEGIYKVWVNGELTVDGADHTGARAGGPLRQTSRSDH